MINKEYWISQNPWRNVSFSPEERVKSFLESNETYQNSIVDYATKKGCTAEQIEKIVKKMDKLAEEYLTAQSRCISSMITGPARFPVAKAESANKRVSEKGQAYYYLVQNYVKIIDRWTRPKHTQTDKKALWIEKIERLKKRQVAMKEANKMVRDKSLNDGKRFEAIKDLGFEEDEAKKVVFDDYFGHKGFAPYELSLNLSEIKRLKEQVALIDRLAEKLDGFDFEGGKVEFDQEDIRWNVFFDCKPDEDTRTRLKKNGFKWSPRRTAWTRLAKTMSKTRLETILKGE
jgi:hypothetical protein